MACCSASVLALALAATAAADIPFTDGPGSARELAAILNKQPTVTETTCRYVAPLVRCRGLIRESAKTDVYLRYRMTVHKTEPHRGYAVTCIDPWSTGTYGFCKRASMEFDR